MKLLSFGALLAAAQVTLFAPFMKKDRSYRMTAPLIDVSQFSAPPRAVSVMPRLKATTPEELVAEINTSFEAFKAKNDERLKAKVDDTVLTEHIDRINASISQLTKAYDEQSKLLAAARLGGGTGDQISPEAAQHRDVFNNWFRRGTEPAEAAMREYEVKAALTTQSDPDGGYLVPEQMDTTIDRVLGTVSVMRQLARIQPIGTMTYTKLVNLGGASSGWVGEEEARPETTGPRLAQIAINAMELYANPAATQTLLDDARVDIAAWLADEVSIEFAEEEGTAFVAGDGIKRPKGILSYTKVANASYAWGKIGFIASGGASDFAATMPTDAFIDLYYALKAGYRGNASWLMSDAVVGRVRKFKDGDGGYIWAPPSAKGEVPTILEKPVYTDDNMHAVGAGNFPVAFGDFRRAYTIVDRMGTRVLRDPYSNKPFVHFYTTKRVGGAVTNFEAIKLLKIAAS